MSDHMITIVKYICIKFKITYTDQLIMHIRLEDTLN